MASCAHSMRTPAAAVPVRHHQPLTTANGIPGTGGALDNASIVAANGYLFVNSGYGIIGGQMPGNLFLAFHVKAR